MGKKMIILFGLVLSVMLLNGCTVKQEGARKVTIRFMRWGPRSAEDYVKKQVERFEELNPDIKVNAEIIPNYLTTILTQLGGGEPPDVFFIQPSWFHQFIEKDALMPLDSFLENSQRLDYDDFFESVLDSYRVDGKLYGLPLTFSPLVIFYNKDLFDEAGLSYPDGTWTWDTFLEAASRLTKKDGTGRVVQYGFSGVIGGSNIFQVQVTLPLLISQLGGRMFNEEETRCTLDSPEAIRAITFFHNLYAKYKVMPSPSQFVQVIGSNLLFNSGRAAMYISGRWQVVELRERKGFNYGIAPLPTFKGKKRVNALATKALVMPRRAKLPQEAWRFMEFIAGPEGQTLTIRWGDSIPSLKSVANSEVFLYDARYPQENQNQLYLDELPYGIDPIARILSAHPEIVTKIKDGLDLMETGQETPEEVARKLAKEVTEMITRLRESTSMAVGRPGCRRVPQD